MRRRVHVDLGRKRHGTFKQSTNCVTCGGRPAWICGTAKWDLRTELEIACVWCESGTLLVGLT